MYRPKFACYFTRVTVAVCVISASYISVRNKAASTFSHTESITKAQGTIHIAQHSGVPTVCLPKLSIARNLSNARFYELHACELNA